MLVTFVTVVTFVAVLIILLTRSCKFVLVMGHKCRLSDNHVQVICTGGILLLIMLNKTLRRTVGAPTRSAFTP